MIADVKIREVTSADIRAIIDTRQPRGLFYTRENGMYVGIDNTTGEAWTEDFKTLGACMEWLHGVC